VPVTESKDAHRVNNTIECTGTLDFSLRLLNFEKNKLSETIANGTRELVNIVPFKAPIVDKTKIKEINFNPDTPIKVCAVLAACDNANGYFVELELYISSNGRVQK
jgi:hypothetical protein